MPLTFTTSQAGAVLVVAALVAMTVVPAFAENRGSPVHRIGDWIVGCDNKAECTAVGIVSAETNPDPTGHQTLRIAIRVSSEPTAEIGMRFEVMVLPVEAAESRPIFVGPEGTAHADWLQLHGDRRLLTDEQAFRWLRALGSDRALLAKTADDDHLPVRSPSGFRAAWSVLSNARAERMRTAPSSPSSASAGEPRKRAFPAQEVMASGLPGIERLKLKCASSFRAESYRQFLLPGNTILWGVQCRNAAVLSTRWFQSLNPADIPTPLKLPDGDRPAITAGELGFRDSVFDFDFGILRAWTRPSGREDCGLQHAWGWDGAGWSLLERREMPVCAGLSPPDWIRTYAAP